MTTSTNARRPAATNAWKDVRRLGCELKGAVNDCIPVILVDNIPLFRITAGASIRRQLNWQEHITMHENNANKYAI